MNAGAARNRGPFLLGQSMKIKLSSFYGDNVPGDVIDTDAKEGARLVEVGGGVEVVGVKTQAPVASPAPANKARRAAPENK